MIQQQLRNCKQSRAQELQGLNRCSQEKNTCIQKYSKLHEDYEATQQERDAVQERLDRCTQKYSRLHKDYEATQEALEEMRQFARVPCHEMSGEEKEVCESESWMKGKIDHCLITASGTGTAYKAYFQDCLENPMTGPCHSPICV